MSVDWGKVLASIQGCNQKKRVGWTVHLCTEEAFRDLVEQKYGAYSGTLFWLRA